MIHRLLAHPLTRGLDLDDPKTTIFRRQIIREKAFLHKVYAEWYSRIKALLPAIKGKILEIGSGAGFMRKAIPGTIPTEVFYLPNISAALNAEVLPFSNSSLRAIAMTDVLHHISHPEKFFKEAARCVQIGGRIIMIEPWVTPWSKFIFRLFHHERFEPDSKSWETGGRGALTEANGAIPWILFNRDRHIFEEKFPEWQIYQIELFMPFRYLLSGGVSLRSLMPGWTFETWRWIENHMGRLSNFFAMFAVIVLVRNPD